MSLKLCKDKMCSKLSWRNWEISSFSSEEREGEGDTNGHAVRVLDGNSFTFWHSQWCGRTAQYPHFLVIDLGEVLDVDKICLTQRKNLCRAVKEIEIYAGKDLDGLEKINSYVLEEVLGSQMFEFPSRQNIRLLKIEMLSSWDNEPFAAISKISLFRNENDSEQCKLPNISFLQYQK